MPWTPTDDFSVAFLTNPKDFLEARGLWQTTAAAGLKGSRQGLTRAWSWSRATSLPFRCSSSPLSVAESFRLAPTVVCGSWGAWMYGHKSLSGSPGGGALAPLAALALQKANLPGREGGREGGKKPAPALLSLRERQKLQSSGSVLTLLSSGSFAQ